MGKTRMICAAAIAAALCGAALAAPPNVSDVALTQAPGTGVVAVSYRTDGAGIATFQFMTNGVDICHSETVRTVAGKINMLLPAGAHKFTWDAGRDFPAQTLENLTVKITPWAAGAPPRYCAVNLAEQNGEFPVRWYGGETELPFGVNNSHWKREWLLLRQIPASEGRDTTLGSPGGEFGRAAATEHPRSVRITKPFYIGVFPVTQRQYEMVMGTRPSYFNNPAVYEERPVESVTYNDIRGVAGASYNWPANGHAVAPTSFMGVLREMTDGVLTFDLPTQAQWEYACRAGTGGAWNNGATSVRGAAPGDPNLDLLGRYRANGGQIPNEEGAYTNPPRNCTDEHGTARVGSYAPNAWGLHDMHGNVHERVLDWRDTFPHPAAEGADPKGPASGTSRVVCGGTWSSAAAQCRSASTTTASPGTVYNTCGFRVAAAAEAEAPFGRPSAQRGALLIPDLKGFVTLKCDFHMHTVFSDGDVWPTVRVEEAFREGLDAIAITDHIEYRPKKDDLSASHNRPYEIAKDLAEKRKIILIRGTEITRREAHYNAIFISDADALDTPDLNDALNAAKAQGAFVFWNHPGWAESVWTDAIARQVDDGLVHGIEVVNHVHYYPNAHRWCMGKNLTLIGNSDVHIPMAPHAPGEHRPMTLVFATGRTPGAIHEALKAGRTAVFFDKRVFGDETYLRELFEAALQWRVRKTETNATVTLTNTSDLTFRLKSAAPDPRLYFQRDITVGPRETKNFRVFFLEKGVDGGSLNFTVENFLTQPDGVMNYTREL